MTDYDNWVREDPSSLYYPSHLEGWMNRHIAANRAVETRVTTAEADIDTNTTNISTNTTNIATNTTNIATNTTNISSNDTDISNIGARLDDLEGGSGNRPYVYAADTSGNQTIATGTTTWFNSFNVGGDGGGATATISAGRLLTGSQDGGIWYAQGQVYWAANATGVRTIYIAKNQSLTSGIAGNRFQNTIGPNGNNSMIQQVSGVFSIAGEDSFDIAVWQNSGSNVDVVAHSTRLTNIVAYKLWD